MYRFHQCGHWTETAVAFPALSSKCGALRVEDMWRPWALQKSIAIWTRRISRQRPEYVWGRMDFDCPCRPGEVCFIWNQHLAQGEIPFLSRVILWYTLSNHKTIIYNYITREIVLNVVKFRLWLWLWSAKATLRGWQRGSRKDKLYTIYGFADAVVRFWKT